MPLSDEDVREILRIIDESPLQELRIDADGFFLHVLKGGARVDATGALAPPTPSGTQPPTAQAAPEPDRLHTIEAPMLGTFYRAEGPGQEPFVEVGSRVEPDTIVCIIEVMKMMNSVPAGVSGTIVEVCSENAQLVEFGEPIFRVEPA